MGNRVAAYDFGPLKQKMIASGLSDDEANRCLGDLLIILHDAEATGRPHAMTEGADRALHLMIEDMEELRKFSAAVFGAGKVMTHDPDAYGTEAFDQAWENTRDAFAMSGIELPADYRSDRGGFRSAAVCIRDTVEDATLQGAAA